ncbi:MAG TPA: hypothetical protein VF997_16705 [Polyangia bacterium]
MRTLVALITLAAVAAGGPAGAQEMIEVPNAPPPPQPTLLEQKHGQARAMLFGGLALLVAGLGIETGAVVYAAENPCVLPLACLFGPSHDDQLVTFAALAFSGLAAVGGGITLAALGGSKLRKLHRPISLRSSGNGVSLGGRF